MNKKSKLKLVILYIFVIVIVSTIIAVLLSPHEKTTIEPLKTEFERITDDNKS